MADLTAPPAARDQLRLLLWLKWRLIWRTAGREGMSRLGLAAAAGFFVPGSLWIAWSLWVTARTLGPHAEDLHRAVLLGVHMMWILSPLVGIALGDTYDVRQLLAYPISRPTLLAALLGGAVLDPPVLLTLPTLAAVAFAVPGPPAVQAAAGLSVGLFFAHAVALNQAIAVATAAAAQSRRARDLVVVLAPLGLMLLLLAFQAAGRRGVRFDLEQFLTSQTWQVVAWLPPGLASRAVDAAYRGDWVESGALLVGLVALAALSATALVWAVRRTYEGEGLERTQTRRSLREPRRGGEVAGSLLPDPIGAVFAKQLRVALRDPFFKSRVLNLLYLLALVYFPLVAFRPPPRLLMFALVPAVVILLFGQMPILGNLFGSDGEATRFLFQSPCRRRDLLLGKNLALLAVLLPFNAALLSTLAALTGQWYALPGVLLRMGLGSVVLAAVGNFLSVWLPLRVVTRQGGLQQHSFARGCGYALIQLAAAAAGAVLLLPAMGLLAWAPPSWGTAAVPAAGAYVLMLYAAALNQAARELQRREEQIVHALAA
ncbi:MAG: hypothetical protein QN163_00980 [Armatimonadota bacterium]|nr:hypothetical protein [Armatimonadota bacterium]